MLAYASHFLRVRSRTRANALYRLLTQTVRSLRYKLTTPRFRALLSAYADGLFVNGLEKKTNAAFAALVFFRHPLHYKHIYSEMLLDFLSNVMPALCICYCFLLFLYFSLAHIKKLAVFQIYAILDLNVILRKMYHQSKSSYTCFLTYFNLFILCRILPVQTFYGCNQVLFFCIII